MKKLLVAILFLCFGAANTAIAQDVFFKTNPIKARELSFSDAVAILQPEIQKIPSVHGIIINEAESTFTVYASGEMEVNVAPFLTKMNAKSANRKVETASFLELVRRTILNSDPFKAKIFKAVIRKKAALDEFEIQTGLQDAPNYIVRRPFIDDLEIAIVAETSSSLAFLPRARLNDLGLTEDEAFNMGIAQIETILPNVTWKVENDLLYAKYDGAFDASLALLPNLWNTLATQNQAKVSLIIPNRGLLVTGRADSEGQMAKLKEIAKSGAEDQFGLSDKVFVWENGAWVLNPQ